MRQLKPAAHDPSLTMTGRATCMYRGPYGSVSLTWKYI